ncbi:hypothetical protein GON03_20345 [Nocardioides sp. MAH-18]|uniref:DUF2613 family protein n=1 Tax=Nocardioides agri TaxID=2682843 RepID=A0A6L6Y1S6_9ACTN|nr:MULTISPECIES: hypothetical protein [unclassified Nocardioides]MBA2952375.1 hypothetical protein [Nocardioides sp. CGMCC 1.13656]MVQ51535.1 hypothetical protein [Nocardioides sp. MAH-18]
MQTLIIGGVALLVGGGLAAGTAIGVVNNATSGTFQPTGQNVLQYGTTSTK